MDAHVLGIITALLGGAALTISSLVLFNLRTMSSRIERVENEQRRAERIQVESFKELRREFVPVEHWIRSENFNRSKLEHIAESVSALQGNLKIVEKMPEIAGSIAREIAGQLQRQTEFPHDPS